MNSERTRQGVILPGEAPRTSLLEMLIEPVGEQDQVSFETRPAMPGAS